MKSHYSVRELVGLPGMPESKSDKIESKVRTIQLLAEREGWQWQKRAGRGGGKEYPFASLPEATRTYLLRNGVETANLPVAQAPRETALAIVPEKAPVKAATLKDYQRVCMDARLGLMRFIHGSPAGPTETIEYLVQHSKDGTLQPELQALVPAANARLGSSGKRGLSARALWRWWAAYKKGDFAELAPKEKDEGQTLEPLWAKPLMKEWRKSQNPKLTEVLEDLAGSIPAGIRMPSYDQARRYLLSLGALEMAKGRQTGAALASLKPYRRRLTDHMYPGDCYTADGHTYDAEVAHPFHGKPFRPEVTPVIDVATRMIVGWSCDLAESGLAVLDALRFACELFGPPVVFYTDNGKGFKNQMLTAPGTGILHRCGITPEYSRPRNPKAHGLSERAHQTVLIKSARELATFIGADMDPDAKRIAYHATRAEVTGKTRAKLPKGLLIEWEAFLEHVNAAVMDYNNRPHSALPAFRDPVTRKRQHLSPAQAWQMGIERMRRELPKDEWLHPANELPDLYHPAVERTVDRGWVRLTVSKTAQPKLYSAPELANWHGEKVSVAFSPSDPAKVWVRELVHGRLIAVAKLNGNADPYFAQSYLEEKREQRADSRRKRLVNKVEEIELERRGKLPVAVTPEAAEAREKVAQICAPPPAELPPVRAVFTLPPTQRGKYRYWCQIDERVSAGETVSDDERRFHTGFQTTAAWKSERLLDAARAAAQ